MHPKTVCRRRFPSWPMLAMAAIASAALVLLLAGWGIAFWIVAPLALVLTVIAVVHRLRRGRADAYQCERTST